MFESKVIARGIRIAHLAKEMKGWWNFYKIDRSFTLEIWTMTLVFDRKDIQDALSIFNKRNNLKVSLPN